jgi:hypothetical protein
VISVHQFLPGEQIPMLKYALYSPDLALCLFFFLRIEKFVQRSPFSVRGSHPQENGRVTQSTFTKYLQEMFQGLEGFHGAVCSFQWILL